MEDAASAHMNMLRVWGGGLYLPDAFYQECDQLGIMVWQEAMFACSPYPRSAEFLNNVRIDGAYTAMMHFVLLVPLCCVRGCTR